MIRKTKLGLFSVTGIFHRNIYKIVMAEVIAISTGIELADVCSIWILPIGRSYCHINR
jgi:hypothetical protein